MTAEWRNSAVRQKTGVSYSHRAVAVKQIRGAKYVSLILVVVKTQCKKRFARRLNRRVNQVVRVHDADKPGLGLAIARQIVEQHGGRIAVASKPGEGTSFTVDLPLLK